MAQLEPVYVDSFNSIESQKRESNRVPLPYLIRPRGKSLLCDSFSLYNDYVSSRINDELFHENDDDDDDLPMEAFETSSIENNASSSEMDESFYENENDEEEEEEDLPVEADKTSSLENNASLTKMDKLFHENEDENDEDDLPIEADETSSMENNAILTKMDEIADNFLNVKKGEDIDYVLVCCSKTKKGEAIQMLDLVKDMGKSQCDESESESKKSSNDDWVVV